MTRAMGLDLGTKTIGVAISDPLYTLARAKGTIWRKDLESDLQALEAIMVEEEVYEIVVGLPKNMNNSLGPSAQRSFSFVEALKARGDHPVYLQDERLSTRSADLLLQAEGVRREKRKDQVDALAATYILQTWLDRRSRP